MGQSEGSGSSSQLSQDSKQHGERNSVVMAQVEEITTDLLDKKYLFSGFVLGKAEWDAATLIKVYQRLLSVHSDGFDYEEVAPQAAHHLSHICKCLRLLGIGHLAPKSQDLVDKSRALRIISALDDKISAKYKPHIAARRIRVIIKKEQKSKSHKPKPRPTTGTVQEDSQESNQENVFPVVPLPKACVPQHSSVPEKTKLKAVQIKKSQPKASVPEAAQPPTVTPESPRDFIPSGRQLQRTPVATTAMQSDNLPTGSQIENDVHYKPEPSNTSETDHDVCCKNSVTMTPVSSHLAHTSHRADNTYPSCTPEPVGDGVQSVLKECVLSHCSSEACIPPVPFSQDISPQSDHGVDVEAEVLAEEKPNIIPTGHQIPRTPKIPDKMLKLYLEEDTCSSNKEMTGDLEAQNTVSPLDLPERCRESDCTQGEENRSVEQETCHMTTSESSSPVHFPLEPIRMLHITSPTKSSADSPLSVDGGLPVHYVLSPPSGYKNNKTFSKTCSESLEGKCLAVQSEFSTLKSPPINHSLEDGCLQTNMTQVKVSYSKMLTTAIHDYESPPSSGSSCGNLTVQDNFSESPVSVVGNDNSSSSVLASVVINESSSSEATLSAESPASAISNNEGTFVCNTEGTYVLGDEGTFVCNTEATYVLGNEGTFVCNSEGTCMSDTEGTFSCKSEGTYMSDTEGTFSCKSEGTHMSDTEGTFSFKSEGTYDLDNEGTFVYSSEGTYVCSNEKTRITNNERTYVCNNKSMCDEPNNLEKLMKNISIENQDYSDSMLKHGAEDDQKHLIANEKDVSVLCENLELNCSLKENASPGGWDSEVNHTEQATPLVQNATYIMSAKKLPGKTNHNEIKVESWKDVDDSSIIPKEHLSKNINSERNIADIKEIIKDKTVFNATCSVEGDTFIHQMQNEKLYMRNDDDSFEIFPHKHKAPRGNGKGLGIFAHITEKPPETGNHSEANKTTDDLECSVIKEPKVFGKFLEEENCKLDPLGETETGTENVVSVHFEKSTKMVLKESNKQSKKGRRKITGKEADTGDEGEATSRQRKGKSQMKTHDVTYVHEQKETEMECVKETARGRRCKQMKNYDENLSPSCVLDSDDSWTFIEKKEKRAKSYAKKNKENQSSRPGKEKKSNNAVNKGNTEEEIKRKTKDEASGNENIVKYTGQYKMDVDESSPEKDMKSEGHQKKTEVGIPENEAPVKSKGRRKKVEEIPDNEAPAKPKGRSKKIEEFPDDETPVKPKGRKKKTEEVPDNESPVKSKGKSKKTEKVPEEETLVRPKGKSKKTEEVPENETHVKCKAESKKTEEVPDEEASVRPKARSKKTEEVPDEEAPVRPKSRSKKTEEVPDEEAPVRPKGRSKKTEEVPDEKTPVRPKSRSKKTEEFPDNEAPVRPKGRSKKTEEVPDDEVLVKPKGRSKKTEVPENETHVKCKAESKETEEVPENKALVKPKVKRKKTEEVPDIEVPMKPKGRSKKSEEVPDIEVPVKPKGRSKKIKEVPDVEIPVKPKSRSKKTEVHDEEVPVRAKGRSKKTEEVLDNENPVKPKGRRKKTEEIPDDEAPVKVKGRQKKSKEAPVTEDQTFDNEMEIKFRDDEEKVDINEATDNETEKKSKKVQGTSKKDTDGQPCTGVTRGRRMCKVKASAAISELLNDSWS